MNVRYIDQCPKERCGNIQTKNDQILVTFCIFSPRHVQTCDQFDFYTAGNVLLGRSVKSSLHISPKIPTNLKMVKMVLNTQCYQYLWLKM